MANSFHKVVHGGALFALGSVSATVLQFVSGVIVIRIVAPSEFGLISLAYITSNVFVTIASLGFRNGVPQFLAKSRGQGATADVGQVAGTALVISFSVSIFFALLQFGTAYEVAASFGKPEAQPVLEAFALLIPPLAMIGILSAIFRGMENSKAKVIFQDITTNVSRMVLLIFVVILGYGFEAVLTVYVLSVWAAFLTYLLYAYSHLVKMVRMRLETSLAKRLIWFSLPLMAAGVMNNVMAWAGTLSLGYLGATNDVALFNAPLRLVNVIPIPMAAMIFLYLPIATTMIARGAHDELKSLYLSTTKWAFLITLPFLLFFVIDAEFIVRTLFGDEYMGSADVLRVLAVGFSAHTLLGPNGMTLISWGDTRSVFQGTLLAAVMVIVLSIILIPYYGALGAAIGTSTAFIVSNLYLSIILYFRFNVHPFTGQYLKPILLVLIGTALLNGAYRQIDTSLLAAHLALMAFLITLVVLAPLVTRSISSADVELIRAIESRVGANARIANWLRSRL